MVDKEATYGIPESSQSEVKQANLAIWYAANIAPNGSTNTETINGEDGKAATKPAGVEINTAVANTTRDDGLDSNTAQPLQDIYDYDSDNKEPNKVKYRIWAVNGTKQKKDESGREVENLDLTGVYFRELNYQDVLPEGLRTQKLWIPVQFISKTARAAQTDLDSDELKVLEENRFEVSTFKLYTARDLDQKSSELTRSDPNVFGSDYSNTNVFDLKKEMLDDLTEADGLLSGTSNPLVSKYMTYETADGTATEEIDEARYYCVDLEAMFLDGVLEPVQLDTEDGGYFLQHNLLAFDYSLKVRTPWRIDYHQNLMRFFGPNKEGNATLTGVRERVPEGQPASDQFTEDPAELLFEGIFADRKYAAGEAHDSTREKEWDLNSRPTVDTDPLVLSKIITNRIGLRLHMAGVNSVVNNNRFWDIDNYKKLRFVNRAAKINLSVNRLPYKNNLATASNAGQIIQVPDLTPLPENGDTFNNRPLGMNYNGNDYGKADPDGMKNPPRDLADMEHLVPGDRISYYVTAVNDKDEYPTESGEMRESITWNNPVLRFEAPEGTRIARWTYMPANYPLGEGKRVDANGHYLDADGNEILDADGKPITDGNNSLIATQPLAITDPDGGVDGYKSIELEDIEAYDPRQPMGGGGYYSVPADQELKDLYSGMEMEKPNIFARFFRSARSGTPEAEDVVRSIVWKINGDIPVNKGIRLLVVLEVEDPDNNGGSNMKGNFIAESLVAVGGLEAHGYEPFYFTSANPQSQAGSFTEQVYNHITLTDPDGNSYQAGALHTTASPAAHLGADEARQEQIGNKDTVIYKRVQAGAEDTFEGDTETMVNGVHAQVLSGGMHIYTEQLPPDVAVSMEDHVDSKEAVLTIGEPQAAKQGSEGMIRNEVHKDLAYMDLTVDFITGNTYSTGETGDVRKLQGFYLNRMPDEDELSYNQTSYGGDRNMMATMYVQLRSDLNESGQIRADLNGLNVPYDPSRPNADRWARNGYRKVYPKRAGYNSDGWSYYRESDGTYQLLDPRDVARFRLEYAALSASDSAKADEVDDYLTLPAVKLYGISRWADIKPGKAQKDYSYNYTVQVTQEWYRDSSMADNYTTPQPGETTEGSEGKTADEMEQEYKDANGIASTSTADDQSTEIEKNTYRYGIGTSVTYPVLRRMANVSLNAETYESVEKATASDATPMDGYRPGQELWSRITAENIGRAQKQPVSRDSSGVLRIQYDGTEQGDNPYHWMEDPAKPAGAAPGPAAKEDVLGTGEIYQPVIIDKVPAQFVDIDPRMLPAGGESAVDGNVREVVISDWNNGPIQIRWWNADGTLKTMGTDYEPPQITIYAMTAGDIGGMQSYDRTLLNKVDAEIAPNDADPARTRAADTRYFVYTYTFKDQKLRTALAPGEKIEIVYRTTAKREGLPVTTYQSEDARTGGRVAYLPRFGEYSHSMNYNYYYYGLNTFDPAVDKTGDKLMDMSNLIHDVGFTGSRTGRKAALTPVVKNGTTVYETVKNADGSDRLYPDSTGQQRYEFLDQSKTVIPGSKVSSYTSMDAGDNSKFFDGDLDSRSRQQVLVGAPLVGNQPDRVTELTYGRDWYSMLAKDRTYGQVAPAGVKPEAGEYVNKGVETSMHWDETGDVGDWLPVTDEDAGVGLKENILWAEDSLHLRMPWLYTATRFVTERYYAGDINGDYDQYDTRLTGSALESMQGRSVYFADEKLRVYTPGIQYGDEYTARLSAINYGDWALDGVTFTYVLPLGVMPNLNEDGTPDLKAFYGGAPASDDGYLAPEAIADQYVTAEVIQRPWDIVGTDYYPAAKTAADPVLADDYYNNTMETYGREDLPWVVRITVKQPLNGWWGRNITDNLTQKDKGYQITVDLKSVVYAQPDSERFYDMVYTEPWDDGIYVKDGEMQPDSDYCQIYDESHRSGDLTVRQNGAYPNTNNGNTSYLVTGWLDRNNYQQIYGMNKVYQAKIGYWGVSTSNFWMFPAFTAYANGRNLFCAMYSAADGGIPAVVTDYNAVEGSGRDTVYTAVSGSQARLLVPVVRHWSEVADERAGEPGHAIEDEKKLDEFYQNMEEPFKISLFAENQVVMKNITAGRNVQNNGASSAGTVHYQDPVTGNYLSFINPFEANNGTSYYQTSPSFDDIGGGWITGDGQVTKSGAKYPLPVLSTLLPEGIVPVDEQGKPWPGPSVPKEERDAWANAQADFDLTVRNVSTLQDGTANREITSGTNVTKDHYRVSISYIEEARRYMMRVVPVAANAEGLDYNPLTDPQNHGDVVEVLNAPRLDWNQSLDINVKVMAVEAPEDRVNLDGVSQEAAWAKRGSEDSNIMLNRWQQNRSFASSLVRGFRFLTDDRSVEEDNGLSMKLMFNPFSVGQEYSGYYMDGKYCNWYGCYNGHYHAFDDTRLDSTGPDGRIKDRRLLGDMIRGAETGADGAGNVVDIEDYSPENIRKQSDLTLTNAMKGGLRAPLNVTYDRLDVNGSGSGYTMQGDLMMGDRFVANTTKIYVKNPNIMLDKRVALSVTEAGLGDNNGSPDYKGRDVHEYKIDEDGKLVRTDGCINADGVEDIEAACLDDYTENPNILLKEGVTFGYGGRVWYGVTVMNKHVDSPMHGETDSSVTGEQDPGAFARLDQPNEYLTDESGNRQKIQDLTAEGSKDKKPSASDLREYEDQLEVRRRKLAESGDVAHGAFVFSDYLPWVLAYDEGTEEDPGICIQTYDSDGNPDELLDLNEARAKGWTIIDNTPKPKKDERDNRKFISITVIPPADQASFGDRQSAYESIGNGKRPAGYLENGGKFTLKIRTRVSDIPDVNKAENYDKDGMSTDSFYNRVFVNLDCLDGNYGKLKDYKGVHYEAGGKPWFGDQKKDAVSYYSGTAGKNTDEKVVIKDGGKLPVPTSVTDVKGVSIEKVYGGNWNQKEKEGKDRYAYDTAAGLKVVSPMGYGRVSTSRPMENRNGKAQDPAYRSTDDIAMYLAETSLVRGAVGEIYTIANLPLYGVGRDINRPDLTAENYKQYDAYKVTTTVTEVKTGRWYVPLSELCGNTKEEKEAYQKLLEEKLRIQVYYTLRSESKDIRQTIEDEFDIEARYDGDEEKPLIWHRLEAKDGQYPDGATLREQQSITVSKDIRDDINQIMWMVTSENPEKYPIPAGFRLDVDVDYDEEGKQDAHELENKGTGMNNGHYPNHYQYFATASPSEAEPDAATPGEASPSEAERDDVPTNGGLITMRLGAYGTDGQAIKSDSYTANYTDIYVNYSDGKYCRLVSNDKRVEGSSKVPYPELFARSGMILVLYTPVGEMKIEGKYLEYIQRAADGEPLPQDECHYKWKDQIKLKDSSKVVSYICTLDNIENERLEKYTDSEDREDIFVNPTIVIRVPPLLTINPNTLTYVPYDEVTDDLSMPLNPAYQRKSSYSETEPLYWTFKVVHRDYDKNGHFTTETEPSDFTDVTLDTKDIQPLKQIGNEKLLKFFFKGRLMPGDSIVIQYMARVTTTNEADPLAKGENKVTYGYATDDVGQPKWVKWIAGDDEAQDVGSHQVKDGKNYDEDDSSSDTLLEIKNDIISFDTVMSFPKFKAVTTVLEPGEVSTTNGKPVPVLEGEYYRYRLNMRNSQTFTPGDAAAGMKVNPIFYDILPYEGDTKITGTESGGTWNAPARGSKWNPWLELDEENFELNATSNAEPQGEAGEDGIITFPEDTYKIWVGPVDVTRDENGAITELKPAGLEAMYSVKDRSRIKDNVDNFFQALGLTALDEEQELNWTVNGLEEANVKKHHVTLAELKEYRESSGMTQAQYEEIRKEMRAIAVTFNNWEGTKNELYRMYASSDFWLSFKVETPLNLPVYSADRSAVSDDALKTQIGRYKAGNSFVGTAKDVYTSESAVLEVYVHNPVDRTQIGDYVWLDTNINGKQDEVAYEVPETGTDFDRKLPKRVKEVDEYGNITYVPDWGKDGDVLKPDPGINGVKVELLNGLGQPCNYDGEAVELEPDGGLDEFGRPLYYKLNDQGERLLDASGATSTTPYGPLSCITKSDNYGNQGYYIFPNIRDGEYRLRFTMPVEYNEYGLTTWEIGNDGDLITMEVVEPGETWSPSGQAGGVGSFTAKNLTFVTADVIHAASGIKDEKRVSYDVGVGLPVRYGGVAWLDEKEDELSEHGYDGYYDSVENPHDDHQTNPYAESGFRYTYEDGDGAKLEEGVTIIACIKGQEMDEQGNVVPALDMHGRPLIVRPLPGYNTTRTMEILKEEYRLLKEADEEIRNAGGTESELSRLKADYEVLNKKYPTRYPDLPGDGETLSEEQLEAILAPFVGTYEFKYMIPGKQYVFYAIPPVENGTGKKIYKMSKTISGDPLAGRYENDGRYNGWTKEFTAAIPQDNSGKVQVVTNKSGQVLHYQDQRLIDFGLVSIDNTMLSGIVWDDDTDRDELPDGSYAEYDGIRKDGYAGIENVRVNLYAYGWVEGQGWLPLKKEDGDLKFVDEPKVATPTEATPVAVALSEATPSQAKPIDTTLTTAGGEWQFKLKPVLETGVEGDRQYYLVGYRVEIPDLPKGYTVTSMHKEISGKKDLEEIDSDLSGNSWLYARREPGQWLNLETDVFDGKDPMTASMYLPYEKAETNEDGLPDANLHTIRLGDVYYDYDAQRTIEHVDAGLTPYAKGSVDGIVWNDAQMVNGKADYDGIRKNGDKGIEDVRVTLQYRIGDVDYASKSEADYIGDKDTDYSRTGTMIPDGTYVDLFTYNPDEYRPWEDETGEAYWISGPYILPRTLEAEERFLEDVKLEEKRIEELKKELEELIRQQTGAVNGLSNLQTRLGNAENAKAADQALLDEKYEKQGGYERERANVEGRKARLEVLIDVRQKSIKDLKEELKQDHTPEEIEEINSEIAALEAETAGYVKEKNEAEATYLKLNEQIWEIGNGIRELLAKMESSELDISALKRQISLEKEALEKLSVEIEEKRSQSEEVYVETVSVRTDKDGYYTFPALPLFDEEQPVKPGRTRETFVQPEPYRYRILVEKAAGLSFTDLKVQTAGANDDNDSDVGLLTGYDYENGNMERYGVGRGSLGVSDSFALMEKMDEDVNAYDGRYHLRQDGDVPEQVRSKRHILRDAGVLAFENRVTIGDYVWEDANGNGIQDKDEPANKKSIGK